MSSRHKEVGDIEVGGFNFVWEIEDFEDQCDKVGEAIRSPYFQIRQPDYLFSYRWFFTLYPYGRNGANKNFLSIYLHNSMPQNEEIEASFKISILSSNKNEETNYMTNIATFSREKSNAWGTTNLISREELLNRRESLLADDALKIKCAINLDTCSGNEVSLNSTLRNDFQELYSSGKFSDVAIQIGRRKIKAHKTILAARSQFFFDILKKWKQGDGQDLIKITDFSYEVMNEVLSFIYYEKVSKIQELALPLLQAAYKYQLNGLKILCGRSLVKNLSIENAIENLKVATSCYCTELKSKTLEFITENMNKVMESNGFKLLKYQNPRLLEEIALLAAKNT